MTTRIRIALVLLMVLTVATARLSSAQARSAPALDLAAMTLLPSDLEDPGYGGSLSGHQTLTDFAIRLNSLQGGSEQDQTSLDETLTEAGWRQSYFSRISVPTDDSADFFRRSVTSTLTEYEDAKEAEDGFTLLTEANAAAGYEPSRRAPEVGDQAVVTRKEGTATDNTTPYQELNLVFQVENVVAEIDLVDFTDDRPSTSELTDLAEAMATRIDAVRDGEAPGLSSHVLRLEGDGVASVWDYYYRRDGEVIPNYNQAVESIESDNNFYAELGITDVYFAQQSIPVAGEDEPTYYKLTLQRFDDEAAAADWAAEAPQGLVDAPYQPYRDVSIVDDAAPFGDESTTLSFSYDRNTEATSAGYLVYLQVADTVAVLEVNSVLETPLSVVEDLADAQAECLTADDCVARTPLPDELAG